MWYKGEKMNDKNAASLMFPSCMLRLSGSECDVEDGLWVVGGWTVESQRGCDCLS